MTRQPARACRVCATPLPKPWLDLGLQPLANALRDAASPRRDEARYPLALSACPKCHLSQLTHVVPRERLYAGAAGYPFRSGVSRTWRAHCEALAREYARPGMLCVDIASNDGTLVKALAARGADAHGVEPAAPPDANYPHFDGWWNSDYGLYWNGSVNLLTATNVLGHVDDVHDFMAGIALALAPDGVALIEVPYVGDLVESLAVDTVYHEHLSVWSIEALVRLANEHGLKMLDVQAIDTHGGSIRATLGRTGTAAPRVMHATQREAATLDWRALTRASALASQRLAQINAALAGVDYVGFGAPAKAATLLGCLDCRALPRVVYDDTAAKQDKVLPGTMVRVEPMPRRFGAEPVVIFAWNYELEARRVLRERGHRGPVFVPHASPDWQLPGMARHVA
jgi:hypothetical protein